MASAACNPHLRKQIKVADFIPTCKPRLTADEFEAAMMGTIGAG